MAASRVVLLPIVGRGYARDRSEPQTMASSETPGNPPNPRTSVNAPQVDYQHYGHDYNTKGRLASFWHQIEEVRLCSAQSVMEVGAGSGYTTAMLCREGVRVVSLDIDPTLKPNVLASVLALPFSDETFDATLCCQVLEHLPWEMFAPSVRELRRVTGKRLIISLPDRERQIRLLFDGPKLGFFTRIRCLPRHVNARLNNADIDPQHFWEIGAGQIDTRKVLVELAAAGAGNLRHYRVFEFPYHHFFVIDKGDQAAGGQIPISAPPAVTGGLIDVLSRCATWRRTPRRPWKPSNK
jgi:SAM-dependent methyltransferase